MFIIFTAETCDLKIKLEKEYLAKIISSHYHVVVVFTFLTSPATFLSLGLKHIPISTLGLKSIHISTLGLKSIHISPYVLFACIGVLEMTTFYYIDIAIISFFRYGENVKIIFNHQAIAIGALYTIILRILKSLSQSFDYEFLEAS